MDYGHYHSRAPSHKRFPTIFDIQLWISGGFYSSPHRHRGPLQRGGGGCYEYTNTELALSGSVFLQWVGRAFSGLPWEGLVLILRGDLGAGLSPRGPLGLLSNIWTIIVIALMLLLAARAGHHLIHKQDQFYSSGTPQKDSASTKPKTNEYRVSAALILIGITLISSSSLMVSVTQGLQRWHEWGIGLRPWRDTLLVQIGWAFALFGALYLLFSMLRKIEAVRPLSGLTNGSKHLLIAGTAVMLFGLTVFTFIANDRYAINRRYDPSIYDPNSHIDHLISMAVVDFDDTERGQRIRCQLLDAYVEEVWSEYWPTSRQLQRELNRLTRSEYGSEFCPVPL